MIPSSALWKIRELYPKAEENYVIYLEGKQDFNFILFEYYTDYHFFRTTFR